MLFYIAVLNDHSSLLGLFLDLSSGAIFVVGIGGYSILELFAKKGRSSNFGRIDRLWKDE